MNKDNELTVLVADDSFTNRSLMTTILSKTYNVLVAANGHEALSMIRETPGIDIIILDIMMPDISGFEILKILSEDKELSQIPVVVVTANNDTENQIKAFDYGAIDIIGKPYNPQIILHRIQNILDRSIANKLAAERKIIETQLEEKIEKLKATQIDFTHAYNRQTFSQLLEEMLTMNRNIKFDLLRFDIDYFKIYNDTFGVKEGDALLEAIGKQLQTIKAPLTLYGHYHADHFVICAPRNSFDAETVVKRINNFIQTLHPDFNFICRLGIYQIEDNNLKAQIICDRAELALFSLKNNFNKRVAYYTEEMRNILIEEQELIKNMKSALVNRQFKVFIQPQYDYSEQKLCGAEALVRWIHPEKGIISPARFIPLFERNGFICKLDEYIWERTCFLQRDWLDKGLSPVPVSVNISRKDIYNPNLINIFKNLISKYNLTPNLLRLEITESAYMDNPSQLIKIVSELRDYGFCVEMDDFGSGYSSLNTLKDIPFDILKLDMEFLRSEGKTIEELSNAKSGIILCSIINMADGLKMPVIAEGVETKAQAEYLKNIGCSFMQGFYFAKPIPVSDYEKILIENLRQIS